MNESSSQPQPSSNQPQHRRQNWPLWLGIGFFSAVGIALLASLINVLRPESSTPPITQAPTDSTSETTASASNTSEIRPPADLREHQKIVSEVIRDLDRTVLIGDSPTRGNPDADVVLFEFSDFQCPYCARATEEVDTFMDANESEVLFVYKHLPLSRIHPQAIPAALAAWAAGQQDQFWPFHDALFANQANLGEAQYVEIADELGLDIDQFNRDRQSEAAQAAIAQDLALAAELQLNSTPTFIMSDLLIPGVVPADFFAEALLRLKAFQDSNSGER